ncbi:MAG: hypothetical protein FWB88_09920 [Defluviitaleaceae bacterium]|nr:hypothetical protein [Defluviitaleaceae bacterium]MCL2239845.1 hypothetical protein [Defluviitaleaceae bacterium]
MGFTGLSIATSGLRVAHANLGVVGHNMSNAEIRGFSRQRIVQKPSMSIDRGMSANNDRMILGMGADRNAVQQLRNEFLDFTYRTQVGRLEFYSQLVIAGREIEGKLGELYGAYNFQGVVNDMWFAIQELTRHPDGFATRHQLLSTANSFLNKAREVYLGLVEEQRNLNFQVIQAVDDINRLVAQVNELNERIMRSEMAGDNANDYRDQRNLALDELARFIPIEIRTTTRGEKNIISGGHELLASGVQTRMGLRFVSGDFDFVIPVLGTDGATISAGTSIYEFINFKPLRPVNYAHNNDFGKLQALLVARGMAPANHMSRLKPSPESRLEAMEERMAALVADGAPQDEIDALQAQMDYLEENMSAYSFNHELHRWSIYHGMIPRVQQNLDGIVYAMVRMMNDALTGQLREANPEWNPDYAGNPARPFFIDPVTGMRTPNPAAADNEPWQNLLDGGRYRFVFREDMNDNFSGPAQHWDIDVSPGNGIPLFERIHGENTGDPDPLLLNSIYTIENLRINPLLLQPGGHNLLALALGIDEVNDTRVLEALQVAWRANDGPYTVEIAGRHFRIQEAYVRLVNQISIDVNEAIRFVENQQIQVIQADNRRQSIKGVSMDEELASMLRFQYAFQAASRVINVIDGMLGIIVNLGRN